MTNTNTLDTNATTEQVMQLADAGCDVVRITAPGIKEARNLERIKNKLVQKGYDLPLVADIHFNPKAAEEAAQYVEKVRINPGNYVDRNRGKVTWSDKEIQEARERIALRLFPLIEICKKHNTSIRVGTNHGSLSERMLSLFGNTPKGMVESAMEFVRIIRDFKFHQLVLSMKASNFSEMTMSNLLLVDKMLEEGFYYPIHLGVTEAGNGDEARIKSAAGIGSLLASGIGDTIRVSLAEMPVNEVPFAKRIVAQYGRNSERIEEIVNSTRIVVPDNETILQKITSQKYPVVTTQKDEQADLYKLDDQKLLGPVKKEEKPFKYKDLTLTRNLSKKSANQILKRSYTGISLDEILLQASADYGMLLLNQEKGGIWIESDLKPNQVAELSLKILQGLGLRYSKTEFVACPSCGRTQFDLFDSFEKVKQRTSLLKGLKIAVMGCIVNGPGEMADADYGYVGSGPGKVTLYKNAFPVVKNVDEKMAVDTLVSLIKTNGDWSESK